MSASSPLELIREASEAARVGDKDRTRELLTEATILDPKNETAWLWLADVCDTPLDKAIALERVLTLNPNNEQAKAALRPIRLKAGVEAAKAKNIPIAKRLLTSAVAEEPGNEFGWLWLASVCDSPHEALSHLQLVLKINPNNAAAKKGITYFEDKIKQLGSTEFKKPSVSAITPPPRQTATSGMRAASTGGSGGKRVLIVDGSRTIRKLVGVTLRMEGYEAVEAADLIEAAERIREEGVPELLVLDIAAKGADVYEFCEVFRQKPEAGKVAIFLLTGKDGQFDRFRARAAGIDTFLAKPLQPELLLHTTRARQSETVPV